MRSFVVRVVQLPGLVFRCLRVGTVVFGYGLVFGGTALLTKFRRKKDRRGLRNGDRWVRMLTRLGPSYIKIGQLMSTRRDLLPDSVTLPLARLTDSSAPPSRRQIERAVRDAYGSRTWPFAEFGWEPVACGSIATVHEAVTWDGRRVAVKLRRPRIERVMRRDFTLTASAMKMMGLLPRLRKMPFKLMHDQVGGAILRQLDFRAEAKSLAALRDNLADFDAVHVPAPYPDLCTDETVVMEFIDDLARFEPGDLNLEVRQAVVRRVLAAVYEMLFVDGVVHCDLHPGNLYFDHNADLVVLDAGFVIRLPEPVRLSFANFFINMAMGAGKACAQIVIDSAAQIAEDCDLDGFRAGLAALVEDAHGALSGEFDLAQFAGKLFDLQRRFGLFPAPEFAFPLLSLLVIEGMIKGFDSDVDFQAEAMPVLARRYSRRRPAASAAPAAPADSADSTASASASSVTASAVTK